MSKLNITFNNKQYNIDESAIALARDSLKTHLSTVMNGEGGGNTITWDCVVGDRATGTAGSGTIVKVSDEVFSAEEFIGCTLSAVAVSGEKEELPISEDGVKDYSGVVVGPAFMFWSFSEAVTNHDIVGGIQVTVPEPGTYFVYSTGSMQSMSLVFPSNSTSGSTTITLDGTSYQVDPTKLQAATDNFVAHIGTLKGGEGGEVEIAVGNTVTFKEHYTLEDFPADYRPAEGEVGKNTSIYTSADKRMVIVSIANNGGIMIQIINMTNGMVCIWYVDDLMIEAEDMDVTEAGWYHSTMDKLDEPWSLVVEDETEAEAYSNAPFLFEAPSAGGDTKLTIGGVDYMVDSANLDTAIANLHATLNRLSSGAGEDTPSELVLEGDGASYYTLAPTTLTFRSEAPLSEFKEVQVNGETLDPSNYTLEEGSTIVTLATNYLKNLNVGGHDISVVSEKGTASGGFSVEAPELNGHGFYYNQPYSADLPAFGGRTAMIVHPDNTYTITTVGQAASKGEYTLDGNNIVASHPMTGVLHSTISSDGLSIYCAELDATFTLNSNTDIASDKDCIYIYDETLGGYDVRAMNPDAKDIKIRTGIYGIDTVSISRFAFCDYSDTLHITIPNTVTSIGEYAFYWCSGLTSITIPSGVTSIGAHAFYSCSGLTSITIPSGMTDIGNYAFSACSGLTSITISDSVAVIGDGAFDGTPVENVTFTGTVNQWNSISKGQSWCNFTDTPNPATYVQCSDGQVTL